MARSFNGTSDFLNNVTGYLSGSSGPFTIALWMKSASVTQTNAYLGDSDDSVSAIGWALRYGFTNDGAGHAQVDFFVTAGGFGTGSQIAILNTNWHHICYRYLGAASEWAYFLDGTKTVINASLTGTFSTGLNELLIGASGITGSNFYNGSLAEIAIWTTNVSDANITSLAAGSKATNFSPGNLIGYWQLCGTASPEPDGSGAGHSVALTGTTAAAHPKPLCGTFFSASQII